MLQKIMPFVFIAVAMAFVPQFLNKTPETIEQRSNTNSGVPKTAQPQTATHIMQPVNDKLVSGLTVTGIF